MQTSTEIRQVSKSYYSLRTKNFAKSRKEMHENVGNIKKLTNPFKFLYVLSLCMIFMFVKV